MRKLNQTFGNVAYGAFSDSNNYATETNNFGETAFGILNKSTIDPDNFTSRDVVKSSKATLFSIGNGTEEERKNVIEIKGNGDVYINGVAGYTGTDTDEAGNIAEEFQGVHDSLDSIHMQKDDDSDLVYTLIVDGEERGTINIPKDQFLEDVNYDDDTKELVFIFVTSDENNKEVRINIGNLVDIYSAGNGLSLTEGQFAIKLDPSTESYITVGADGLKVSGLDAKFDTLTQKDTEQDERIQTAETDIDALQSDLSALKGDGEGSIGNQIQTAVDALKGGVSESYDTLKKIEDSIVSTNDKFDEYLPLSGGTLTGKLYGEMGVFKGFNITQQLILLNSIDCDLNSDGSLWMIFDSDKITSDRLIGINVFDESDTSITLYKSGIKFSNKTSSDLLHAAGGTTTLKTINNTSLLGTGNIEVPTINTPVRISTENDLNTFLSQGNVDYYYTMGGQKPANSPTAGPYFSSIEKAGESSYLQTVKSVRANGDVREYVRCIYNLNESPTIGNWHEVAFVTDIQDITGSNTYTGTNYISKETNLTDAVIQLDEEIKATNDNLSLEHANAEATYAKKTDVPTNVSQLTNDAGYQTEAQVSAKVSALVDGAPETLDTLNELAAALGDDPNFATTVTNQIAQKANKTTATTSADGLMSAADKAKLDSIETSTLATKAELEGYLPLSGGTMTGNITFESTPVGNVGDAVLYDRQADKLIIVPTTDDIGTKYPSDNYEPIGVVVIPASHDVYGTGECGVMSLKPMNCDTPSTGGTSEQSMYWGVNGTNISGLRDLDQVPTGNTSNGIPTGQASSAYLPSDKFRGTQCAHDTDVSYYNTSYTPIPSPYLTDGSRNPGYYQPSLPSSSDNALADFDGIGNTEKIITQRGTKDYNSWTPGRTTAADYPAASCCDMFYTEGTSQGDWYLPAFGELGYIMPPFNKINEVIDKMRTAYGSSVGVELSTDFSWWSSTEFSSNFARNVDTGDGAAYRNLKYSNYFVRAWLRVLPTSTGIIISGKSETDLLNAAGGTTTLKTINGESLSGSGDITTPAPTVNAASGTKTIWTGTQSEYDGVTSKDANTLYFITEG